MIFFNSPAWIVGPVILPLAAALLCFLLPRKAHIIGLVAAFANTIAVALLLRILLTSGSQHYRIGGWSVPLGIALRLDGPAALLLVMTVMTGVGISLYARGYFSFRITEPKRPGRHERQEQFFWPLWMMLWTAMNGMFLAADIFNIYVTLELAAIAAIALAALSGKPAAQIAAFRYLLASLLGSISYLLGVVFIYKTYAVLDLELLGNMATAEPGVQVALALMSIGLLLKTALFPLHFWLPPAHANALAPVSAILSGLVVKGSFFLLFRFWFETFRSVVSMAALDMIGILGAVAVLWGAVQAMRQQRLKLLIAYSTVSQLGYLFIAFPLARFHDHSQLWSTVLFMAIAHAAAKAAMFMAAGTIFLHAGHDRISDLTGIRAYLPVTAFTYAIAGVSLIGLPPSGGFIAKWLLLTSAFASDQWWWALVVMAGSFLAAAYVYRVVSRLFVIPTGLTISRHRSRTALLEWPALALALISLLMGLAAPYPLLILDISGPVVPLLTVGGLP